MRNRKALVPSRWERLLAGSLILLLISVAFGTIGNTRTGNNRASSPSVRYEDQRIDPSTILGGGLVNSLSVGDDVLVVGAALSDRVHVFHRDSNGNWVFVRNITPSDNPSPLINFGFSVATDGQTIVVGGWHDSTGGNSAGAAYVYSRNAGGTNNWGEVQKLTAPDANSDDYFGWAVDVSGPNIVVGANRKEYSDLSSAGISPNVGAVYVFFNTGSNWQHSNTLRPVNPVTASYTYFGESVAIDGNRLIAGAIGENHPGSGFGAAYVFGAQSKYTWTLDAVLKSSDSTAQRFGGAVDIDGSTVVVGAPLSAISASYSGAAYVFERKSSGWSQPKRLLGSTTSKNDNFGWDVSIHDDVIAVGSIFDGIGDLTTGMIHVFARNLPGINTWGESFVGLGSDSCDGAFFGRSVAVDGSDIVTHDFVNPCNNNRSAVYVFKP